MAIVLQLNLLELWDEHQRWDFTTLIWEAIERCQIHETEEDMIMRNFCIPWTRFPIAMTCYDIGSVDDCCL